MLGDNPDKLNVKAPASDPPTNSTLSVLAGCAVPCTQKNPFVKYGGFPNCKILPLIVAELDVIS